MNFKKENNIKYIYLILLVILSACVTTYTPKKVLPPIPPKPQCLPNSFNEVKFDTSSRNQTHFKIEKVRGMDSPKNEWALNFFDADKILFTYGNDNKQEFREYTFVTPTVLSSGPIVKAIDEGPYGIASVYNNTIYFVAEIDFLTENTQKEYDDLASKKGEKTRIPLKFTPGKSRIFKANIQDRTMSNVSQLNSGNELGIYDWEAHPAVSPNGKVLFFASTRMSEDNGTQIFFSSLDKNGELEKIQNLEIANTPCDEFSPFISKDGKRLYFSSNGHSTVGGYDIFYCDIDNNFWNTLDPKFISNPINIGKPVNTESDELFPSSPEDPSKLLYYSSDQSGNFDIFVLYQNTREKIDIGEGLKQIDKNIEIKVPEPEVIKEPEIKFEEKKEVKIESKPIVKSYFSVAGLVKDGKDVPLQNIDVKVRKQGEERVSYETKTNKLGEYELSLEKGVGYEVRAQDDKHFYDTYYISKEETERNETLKKEFILDQSLDLRLNFPYDIYDKPYDNIIDENGLETNKNWVKEVDEVAKNIIERIDYIDAIILTGHTDLQGSQDYNYTLGLNRAKFVYEELIKRGIPKKKIQFKSVGKLEPLEKKNLEPEEYYARRLRRVNVEIINKKK